MRDRLAPPPVSARPRGRESRAPASTLPLDLPSLTADIVERIRAKRPRIHCITNAAAQSLTPNLLLAAGAIPSLTIAPEEIAAFVAGADALLVNLGTFDPQRQQAADIAVDAAGEKNLPWILDPVFIERSPARAGYARELVRRRPAAIRLNRAEFSALAGFAAEGGALTGYAHDNRTVIGLTGEIDHVDDGSRLVTIENGDPLMARVTALGCAGSALVAACHAVERDPWLATAAGLLALGIAGEMAAAQASGPGSFAVAILDALYRLDREQIVARARVV
jgi:hydroxyethylthiazole kinase